MENHPKDPMIEETVERAGIAALEFAAYDQEKTDFILRNVYEKAFGQRHRLAVMAHEETGIGNIRDKVIKNIIATRFVYRDIRSIPTCEIIAEDPVNRIIEVARPMGPVFAVTPVTNPTSTALFKILIALKTRNPIIFHPHGAARKCTIEAARICYEAALEAGAPEHCIQWIPRASRDQVLGIMSHRKVAMVMATGSVSLVRAASRSGNPVIGVGPGNVPVYIGKSADVSFAVDQILLSKLFDNGTICASEQAVIVSRYNAGRVREEFKRRGGYFLNETEIEKVGKVAISRSQHSMSVEVIGRPATEIARLAGITIPEGTKLLMAELRPDQTGYDHPLSLEILAPILAFYEVDDFAGGIAMCQKINELGGLGHTVSIFSNDDEKIRYFAHALNAGRIVVNTPSSQGALGGLYNALTPSMTLACGSGGKSFTTDNISVKHLLNIQRIAYRKVSFCSGHQQSGAFCCDEHVTAESIEQLCRTEKKSE